MAKKASEKMTEERRTRWPRTSVCISRRDCPCRPGTVKAHSCYVFAVNQGAFVICCNGCPILFATHRAS
jgi:hypothetical protein